MLSSFDLRDRLGTQWHWEWFQYTPWDRREQIMYSLVAAGIRNLRGRCWPDDPAKSSAVRDHPVHTWLEELAGAGFNFLFGIGQPWPGMLDGSVPYSEWDGPLGASIDTIARRYKDVCLGLEAPNEYDNVGSPTSPNVLLPWDGQLREWIRRAGAIWQADSRVSSLPFVGPSFVFDQSAEVIGDMRSVLDVKNCHPYIAGPWPQSAAALQKSRYDAMLGPAAPWWSTEFGTPAALHGELAQARLLIQEFFALTLAGSDKSFIYAWVDTQQDYGVLRNDLTARPAYDAIRKLMSLCDDADCVPAPLSYTVTGQTSGVRWFPLGNADGSHLLCVWREAPWGSSPQTVHLTFANDHHLVSHDLISGSDDCPKDQAGGFVYDLVLGDDPVVLSVS